MNEIKSLADTASALSVTGDSIQKELAQEHRKIEEQKQAIARSERLLETRTETLADARNRLGRLQEALTNLQSQFDLLTNEAARLTKILQDFCSIRVNGRALFVGINAKYLIERIKVLLTKLNIKDR